MKKLPVTGDKPMIGSFLYPSAPLGLDPATPIASLRLKHISNGMDDFDYLQLAKETFGEDSTEYKTAINTVFGKYEANGAHHIFASERSPYNSDITYEWIAWDANIMKNARIALGNALSGKADDAHDYGEWQTITEKDETHNGLKIRVCESCGAQDSEYDYVCGENDHSFTLSKNDPKTHKKVCEYCKKTELVAHSETAIPAVEATCVKGGSTAGVKCSECGYIITAPATTAVNSKNHAWDGGKQTKAPTCKEAGVKTFTCTGVGCGATKTESIAKTAHSYTAKVVPASCEKEGYTLHTCKVCGNSYKDNTVKATGHQYENGTCRVCKKTCSCMCHKGGFYNFLWKIMIFFCKIFGQRKMCECGIAHY